MPITPRQSNPRAVLPAMSLAALLVAAADPARAQGTVPDGFSDHLVIGGLNYPVGMAPLSDGRVFVIEQKSAKIRLLVNGALAATDPVCVVDQVNPNGNEQGLLGIAVDPGWPANPYVYVHCDETTPPSTIRISRYTVTGDLSFTGNGALSIDPASRRDLINILPDAAVNHNGGTLRFGPDGMLYDSMGEDAQACLAQDDSTLHGVILRLDVTRLPATPGGPPTLDVITPPDNPQIGSGNALTRLIWAFGLRNPFRFRIDAPTGTLYIGDVGEATYEEVDRAPAGGLNFGWPYFEAYGVHDATCDTSSATTRPIAWYDRTAYVNAAVICAGLYRAPAAASTPFPNGYDGNLFFSDYYIGFLRRYTGSGNNWSLAPPVAGQPNATDWGSGFDAVSDYFVAADGSLWYCRQHYAYAVNTGQIRRIVAQAGAGGGAPPGPPAVALGMPYPQPGRANLTLPYSVAVDCTIDLRIYDLHGGLVRHLIRGEWQAAGTNTSVIWDGRTDSGADARAGIYQVRISGGGHDQSRTAVLLR
jgi:glucose/arabinose dehydrogenase